MNDEQIQCLMAAILFAASGRKVDHAQNLYPDQLEPCAETSVLLFRYTLQAARKTAIKLKETA